MLLVYYNIHKNNFYMKYVKYPLLNEYELGSVNCYYHPLVAKIEYYPEVHYSKVKKGLSKVLQALLDKLND